MKPRYRKGDNILFDRPDTTPLEGQVLEVSSMPTINGDGSYAITWCQWLGTGPDRYLSYSQNVHSDRDPRITPAP